MSLQNSQTKSRIRNMVPRSEVIKCHVTMIMKHTVGFVIR